MPTNQSDIKGLINKQYMKKITKVPKLFTKIPLMVSNSKEMMMIRGIMNEMEEIAEKLNEVVDFISPSEETHEAKANRLVDKFLEDNKKWRVSPPTKNWEKELEEMFYPFITDGKGYNLKLFISSLLSTSKEQWKRDLWKKAQTQFHIGTGYEELLAVLLDKI